MNPITRLTGRLARTQALAVAAWREALAADRDVVTLDDLLVAALTQGGPTARILARHGLTPGLLRDAVRRRDAEDLASVGVVLPDAAPVRLALPLGRERHVDLTPEARQALDGGSRSDVALLRVLLHHPSGRPARALTLAGADLDALRADLDDDAAPAPTRPSATGGAARVPGLLDGVRETTIAAERFLPVPPEAVRRVVTEPELMRRWMLADVEEVTVDGDVLRSRHRRATGEGGPGRELTVELRRLDADADSATWQHVHPEQADPRGAYLRVELRPAEGGTDVRIVRGLRVFGRLGPLVRPVGALAARAGMPGVFQQLGALGEEVVGPAW